MDWHLEEMFSAISLFGIALAISKWAISRALRDLDYVTAKVNEIMIRLSKLDAHDEILKTHSEKLAAIEKAKIAGL